MTEHAPAPTPQEAFGAAIGRMAQAVSKVIATEQQVDIVQIAVQLNGVMIQLAALIDELDRRGAVPRGELQTTAAAKCDEFTAEISKPRIALAAPRGRQ